MDISTTIQANSLQINADDLTAAPRTVTITNVEAGTAEQPVFIHVAEFPGRTYRPGKSMRRVLVALWGAEASAYVGRRLTLFNDTSIRFGKDVTGGIRISHMSHIEKPATLPLTVTRGKRAPFIVQPLPDAPPAEDRAKTAINALTNAPSIPELDKLWARVVGGGLNGVPAVKAAYDDRALHLSGLAAEQ
jgi:hypothetical protein